MTLWHPLLRRRAVECELDAELRDHIEREVVDGIRAGESEADVRRQMRLTSGGLDQVKEACRRLLVQRRSEDARVEAGGCGRIRHDDVEVLDAEIRKRQPRLRRYALAKRQDAGQEHQSTYDADHESDHAILPLPLRLRRFAPRPAPSRAWLSCSLIGWFTIVR
jgi:hypothetical protein